eukprot:Tamp_05682.p1 GENE.Tamp_05682~~Tamp_05682.p1  ORF type:complete len:493 (-),score=63.14 Tamp_05682:675-2153(-)
MKSAGGGHNEVGSMSPRPQLAGVREIGANGSGREGGGAGGGPGGPTLSQSISLDRERSVRDAATETEGDGDAGRRIDFATYSRVFEENAHLSKQLAEAQADAREQARKQEAVQRELGDASFTPSKSARQLELENTSLQRDLLAANAKRLDAEKRITALEHEVMTLTDVSHRLTDQLTKSTTERETDRQKMQHSLDEITSQASSREAGLQLIIQQLRSHFELANAALIEQHQRQLTRNEGEQSHLSIAHPQHKTAQRSAPSSPQHSSPEAPNKVLAGHIGLKVTAELPRSVTSIDDLVDPNMVKQGEPGYSNPLIFVGDILLTVDGYNVETMSLDALHTMLMGDQHTVVEIGLMRRQTNLEYTVRALRHRYMEFQEQEMKRFTHNGVFEQARSQMLAQPPPSPQAPRLLQPHPQSPRHAPSGYHASPGAVKPRSTLGITISKDPPYTVLGVHSLMDKFGIYQGKAGYSNMPLEIHDRIVKVFCVSCPSCLNRR